MLRRSISMKLMASTAQILPFSRFLDLVIRHPVGLCRRMIYWSQGNVKTESYYLKCCLLKKSLQTFIIVHVLHFTSICNINKAKGSKLCCRLSIIKYSTIKISKPINRNSIDISDIDTEIHIDLNPCRVNNNNNNNNNNSDALAGPSGRAV